MTYVIREIDLSFQLGNTTTGQPQSFGGTGANQLTLTGLRVLAKVSTVLNNTIRSGGTTAVLRIYGMTLDQMNQLTVAGTLYKQTGKNKVTVNAGDAGEEKTTVFSGIIIEAYPDFTEAPQSAFVVTAVTAQDIAMKPVAPLSFQGPTSADTAFQQMASNAGCTFENNGVNAQLASPYFPGTTMSQIATLGKAADCNTYYEGSTNTLVAIPKNGNRGGGVPTISPATGMIGYPSYENVQVVVRCVFDPSVKFWGLIQVDTGGQLPPAEGQWRVDYLDYTLASQLPDGPWEMLIKGVSATTGMQ